MKKGKPRHFSTFPGKRVMVSFKDGTFVMGKFKDKYSKYIEIYDDRAPESSLKIYRKDIAKFLLLKERTA
jgi:hypothetical protein